VLSQTVTLEKWDDSTDPPALRLFSTSETANDWPTPGIQTAPNGEISVSSVPPQRASVTETLEYDSEGEKTRTRTSRSMSYGDDGYMRADTTTKEVFDSSGASTSTTDVKTYKRNGLHMYEITQIRDDGSVQRTHANGTPPGGPGRGRVLVPGLNAGAGAGSPVVYATVISSQPGARDVTVSNNNLTQAHLGVIAAQAAEASGATEVEVSFTAANIPWLRRGGGLALTGLTDEGGGPIALSNFLITEVKHEYREGDAAPTYLTHVRASYWAHSPSF
jgi:hypothetical protein